jgi:hypothetical protein
MGWTVIRGPQWTALRILLLPLLSDADATAASGVLDRKQEEDGSCCCERPERIVEVGLLLRAVPILVVLCSEQEHGDGDGDDGDDVQQSSQVCSEFGLMAMVYIFWLVVIIL